MFYICKTEENNNSNSIFNIFIVEGRGPEGFCVTSYNFIRLFVTRCLKHTFTAMHLGLIVVTLVGNLETQYSTVKVWIKGMWQLAIG